MHRRNNHHDLDVAYDYELVHFYAQHDYYLNGASDYDDNRAADDHDGASDDDDGGSCSDVRVGWRSVLRNVLDVDTERQPPRR
jgi:hypothetical protein